MGLQAEALWAAGQHPQGRPFVHTQPSVNAAHRAQGKIACLEPLNGTSPQRKDLF